MHQLNSILIEGKVNCTPVAADDNSVQFTILSKRYFKDAEGAMCSKTLEISISTDGSLASKCLEVLKPGRGVRIVGRIDIGNAHDLYVYADHVEFKPIKA